MENSLGKRLRELRRRPVAADAQTFTWGKHEGKSFSAVFEEDEQYVQWCADNMDTEKKPLPATSINQKAWMAYIRSKVEAMEAAGGHAPASSTTDSGPSNDAIQDIVRRLENLETRVNELAQLLQK
jgi:hypothetical protein